MKIVWVLSGLLLCSGVVMAKPLQETKHATKFLNAYASVHFCSEMTDDDVLSVGHDFYVGKHQDLCGHGGNAMPRQALTAVQKYTDKKGRSAYQVAQANILEKLDIWGYMEDVKRDGETLVVTMRQMGPEDARCCPSIKMQYTIEVGTWKLLKQQQIKSI